MKSYKEQEAYIKDDEVVFVGNTFIYEVCVYNYFKNYFSLVNSALYESKVFIEKTVRSIFINKYTEICCELYQAPKEHLEEHGYKPQTKENQRRVKQATRKTTRTRTKKL